MQLSFTGELVCTKNFFQTTFGSTTNDDDLNVSNMGELN